MLIQSKLLCHFSGSSTYRPQQSDSDSEATFDRFEPLTDDDQNKLAKIGKFRTVEYGLKRRKQIRSYISHEGALLAKTLT